METAAAETSVLETWKITQDHVLRELPSLLEPIAHHMEHFEDATSALWELTRRSNRDHPTKQPPNGWTALEALAAYGRYKPAALNIKMAEMVADFARSTGAFVGAHTPLDLADKLLAKEGEYTEQDGFTISFGGFPLNYEVVKPARDRALALMEECLNSDNPRIALRALRSISHVLSGFLPMIGRQVGEVEATWQNNEREAVLRMLERRLEKQPVPVPVLRKIRSVLLDARPRTPSLPIVSRIDSVLAAVPQGDDVLIFDVFCSGSWDHDGRHESIEAATAAWHELVNRAVTAFHSRYPSPQEKIAALVRLVADAGAAGVDLTGKCGDFMERLCSDQTFLDEFIPYLLGDPDHFLAQMICFPLTRFRSTDPARYRELGLQGANHKIGTVALGTSSAVCYGPHLSDPLPEDMEIIKSLSSSTHGRVRFNAFLGVGRIGGHRAYERDAIRIILTADLGDSPVLAEELCEAFGPTRIRFEALSESDVGAILRKFVPVNELNDHWTTTFLDQVGRVYPESLFRFLMERLDVAAAKWARGESLGDYTPVTGHRTGGAFHSLQKGSAYSSFLTEVRDRYVNQTEQRYWLGRIFWEIGMLDAPTLSTIDDLFHSRDLEKMRAAIGIVAGAPSGLALSRPYFVAHVLELCEGVDRDLLARASSTLIANAQTGGFSKTPGSPSPKFQQMEQRSSQLRDQFPVGSAAYELFSKLCATAASALERERMDDEQFGFDS